MQLMKASFFIIGFIASVLWIGCGSSEETGEKKEEKSPPPEVVQKPAEQPLKDAQNSESKTDTVTVNVQNTQRPMYDQKSSSQKYSIPSGKFSVQIGAYKMPDNAERVASLAKERFVTNVYTIPDKASDLYKVMVGDFSLKEDARKFRDDMAQKYPGDYKDAWVSEIIQK